MSNTYIYEQSPITDNSKSSILLEYFSPLLVNCYLHRDKNF